MIVFVRVSRSGKTLVRQPLPGSTGTRVDRLREEQVWHPRALSKKARREEEEPWLCREHAVAGQIRGLGAGTATCGVGGVSCLRDSPESPRSSARRSARAVRRRSTTGGELPYDCSLEPQAGHSQRTAQGSRIPSLYEEFDVAKKELERKLEAGYGIKDQCRRWP